MADDLSDAEDELRAHDGIDNHPHGKALVRLVRTVRAARTRLLALEDRVKALEDAK